MLSLKRPPSAWPRIRAVLSIYQQQEPEGAVADSGKKWDAGGEENVEAEPYPAGYVSRPQPK